MGSQGLYYERTHRLQVVYYEGSIGPQVLYNEGTHGFPQGGNSWFHESVILLFPSDSQ